MSTQPVDVMPIGEANVPGLDSVPEMTVNRFDGRLDNFDKRMDAMDQTMQQAEDHMVQRLDSEMPKIMDRYIASRASKLGNVQVQGEVR